jgi:hypothetical protein
VIDTQTMIRELCDAHTHREHVEREHVNGNGSVTLYGEDWATEQPSLLDQLADAVHHVRNGEDAGGSGPQSKPTAQIDALDTLQRISAQAYEWAQRSTLAATVQAAYALTPSMPACQQWNPKHGCCHRHILEHQIGQWWTWARLTTGWDRPALRPDATCPACGKRGGLRVRLDDDQRYAMCGDCATTWRDHEIGRLVIHLKAEAECAEAGCDHRASHTIRVCDTTYRDLTRSNSREIVPPVGDVSPREAGLLSGLVP